MKKMLLGLTALLVLAGCSFEKEFNMPKMPAAETPSTEVYVAGTKVTSYTDAFLTRSSYTGEVYDRAYFFIRIDPRIPGLEGNHPTSTYYPQEKLAGKIVSQFRNDNKGTIKKEFAYKYAGTNGETDYIFDPTGQATNDALVTIPSLDGIFKADELTPLKDNFKNVDRSKIKIIWYVVKNRPEDIYSHHGIWRKGAWHIDGVVTMDTTTDVTEIPDMYIAETDYMESSAPEVNPVVMDIEGALKVDIHQQVHKDWESIKTTLHIGAVVDSVKVSFPIARADIAEKDDFAIRTYDAYYTINADFATFQKVIASEYKNNSEFSVETLAEYTGNKSIDDETALTAATGETFAVIKSGAILRLFDVYDNNLYEFNYINMSWQPNNNFNILVKVAHEEEQTVIIVKNISPDIINAQTLVNPDGLTVEVWSYPRLNYATEDITEYRESVYQKLQQAKVEVGFNQPNYSPDKDTPAKDGKVYTQVSSAFF